MKVVNTTDIPTERLREIIEFCKPNGLPTSKFTVRVTNSSGRYTGKFYPTGYTETRPLVIARVTPDEKLFPHMVIHQARKCHKEYYQKFNVKTGRNETWYHKTYEDNPGGSTGGYIDCLILTREEALVNIMSHELRHLWQSNHPKKRGKVWGARGQYSDRDADYWAIRKMREWRRLHQPLQIFVDDSLLWVC